MGPAISTNATSATAATMLMFDSHLMPLSMPVTTDTSAIEVITMISTTSSHVSGSSMTSR